MGRDRGGLLVMGRDRGGLLVMGRDRTVCFLIRLISSLVPEFSKQTLTVYKPTPHVFINLYGWYLVLRTQETSSKAKLKLQVLSDTNWEQRVYYLEEHFTKSVVSCHGVSMVTMVAINSRSPLMKTTGGDVNYPNLPKNMIE